MNKNLVILLGNIAKEPELRHTISNIAVCSFTLATSEKYKEKKVTEFHRILAYGKIAEACDKYLAKGDEVLVEGKLRTNSWEKDGKKFSTIEIHADSVQFGKLKKNKSSNKNEPKQMEMVDEIDF